MTATIINGEQAGSQVEIRFDYGDTVEVWGDLSTWQDQPQICIQVGGRTLKFEERYDLDLSNWEACKSEPVSVFA